MGREVHDLLNVAAAQAEGPDLAADKRVMPVADLLASRGEMGDIRPRAATADEPFTIENEQLTPSMKIRRHVISDVYGERLAALYHR